MEYLLSTLGLNLAAAMLLMICVWPFSVIKKDAGMVDVFWGLGFMLIAWHTFLHADGFWGRRILVVLLTSIWGLRLALHIYYRQQGRGEDRRYKAWRDASGKDYWWVSLFTVFGLQGLLLWIISLVLQVPQLSPQPANWVWSDGAGLILWTAGMLFESVADLQLLRFKADPAHQSRILRQGLWAWSRHPNYFGECLVWWGFYLIALASPRNFWVIVSPLTITFLLLKVSGVTLLDKTLGSANPEYREYMRTTPAFWPRRPAGR